MLFSSKVCFPAAFAFFAFLFFSSCHSRQAALPNDPDQIVVYQSHLRLFAKPGADARALRDLKKGEVLHDLGQVSSFLTPLILNGNAYMEPWLKVRSAQGETGWVYGAVLYNQKGESAPQLIPKRMSALFGRSLAHKIEAYQLEFGQAQSDTELARAYHHFREILDSLTLQTAFAEAVDPSFSQPELQWLPQVLPGVVLHKNQQRDTYYFFSDFGKYKSRALQTRGLDDDAFFDWCIWQYPADSIEYLFPKYIIETEPEVGHSLLGRGLHLQALQQLDALYRRKTAFEPDLIADKNRCIDDITASKAAFWETRKKIMAELTQICQSDLVVLTKADKIALETRLEQLKKPGKYGLTTDFQAGRAK